MARHGFCRRRVPLLFAHDSYNPRRSSPLHNRSRSSKHATSRLRHTGRGRLHHDPGSFPPRCASSTSRSATTSGYRYPLPALLRFRRLLNALHQDLLLRRLPAASARRSPLDPQDRVRRRRQSSSSSATARGSARRRSQDSRSSAKAIISATANPPRKRLPWRYRPRRHSARSQASDRRQPSDVVMFRRASTKAPPRWVGVADPTRTAR